MGRVYIVEVSVDTPVLAESKAEAEQWLRDHVNEWSGDLEFAEFFAADCRTPKDYEGVYPWNSDGDRTIPEIMGEN